MVSEIENGGGTATGGLGRFLREVANSIMSLIGGARPVREEAVRTVADSTSTAIKAGVITGGDLYRVTAEAAEKAWRQAKERGMSADEAAAGVVRAAIEAGVEVGGEITEEIVAAGTHALIAVARASGKDLGHIIRNAMRAGLDAALERELDMVTLAQRLAREVIQDTAKAGGDLSTAVQSVVAGAIDAAKDSHVSVENAAVAAATGALEAAGRIDHERFVEVRSVLDRPINGVEVVLRDPTRHERTE